MAGQRPSQISPGPTDEQDATEPGLLSKFEAVALPNKQEMVGTLGFESRSRELRVQL
jgi:hypothetical protein